MMTKEGYTKIVNFMTHWSQLLVLGRGHISHIVKMHNFSTPRHIVKMHNFFTPRHIVKIHNFSTPRHFSHKIVMITKEGTI